MLKLSDIKSSEEALQDHYEAHRHVCCTNYHVIEGSGY